MQLLGACSVLSGRSTILFTSHCKEVKTFSGDSLKCVVLAVPLSRKHWLLLVLIKPVAFFTFIHFTDLSAVDLQSCVHRSVPCSFFVMPFAPNSTKTAQTSVTDRCFLLKRMPSDTKKLKCCQQRRAGKTLTEKPLSLRLLITLPV